MRRDYIFNGEEYKFPEMEENFCTTKKGRPSVSPNKV